MKIYLVRHGETDWNQAGLLQGQTDIALNAQGLEQAHDAAERLKKVPFEIAFCSPLIREDDEAVLTRESIQLLTILQKELTIENHHAILTEVFTKRHLTERHGFLL